MRKDGPVTIKQEADQWVQENLVSINGIIKIELISGCKTDQEAEGLSEQLAGLQSLQLEEEHYEQAALANFKLLRRGITVPLSDLLIVVSASAFGETLVHADVHFESINKVLPLKLLSKLKQIEVWKKDKARRTR